MTTGDEETIPRPATQSSTMAMGMRVLLGLLGGASFAAGVLAVFVSTNGTGTGVLLGFGGLVLVVALLGNRIESFEFGGTRLRLRAAAAERYARAEESERRGDLAEAERLRAEAQALLDVAGPIAAEYRSVRSSMPAGGDRTRAMEEVIDRARRVAESQPVDAAELSRWLREGSEAERVVALAMMQARPETRDFDATLAAIADSRSAFEQYHALRLALQMVDDLDPEQRRRLAEVTRAARGMRFKRDSGRWHLSEEVLRRTR